jgi:hypothetical protein
MHFNGMLRVKPLMVAISAEGGDKVVRQAT